MGPQVSAGPPSMGPLGGSGGLPGSSSPSNETEFDFAFAPDDVYDLVSNMEDFLLKKKSKMEPYKLSQLLGFAEPDIFYNFIVNLRRDDLIKFDGGKIVVNTDMNPVDAEEFLKKYERYLKTGRI